MLPGGAMRCEHSEYFLILILDPSITGGARVHSSVYSGVHSSVYSGVHRSMHSSAHMRGGAGSTQQRDCDLTVSLPWRDVGRARGFLPTWQSSIDSTPKVRTWRLAFIKPTGRLKAHSHYCVTVGHYCLQYRSLLCTLLVTAAHIDKWLNYRVLYIVCWPATVRMCSWLAGVQLKHVTCQTGLKHVILEALLDDMRDNATDAIRLAVKWRNKKVNLP